MPLNRSDPNYYSSPLTLNSSSTAATGVGFGFPASYVRLLNTGATDVYVNPQSSTLCTTADLRVRACSDLVLANLPAISVLTAYATSTAGAGAVLNVTALG